MSTTPKKSYFELAKEAITALKERTGSSQQAIKAHIVANHPTIKFAQHLLRGALNKGADAGKFVKVKASYKLGAEEKKVKKAVTKKAAPAPKAAAVVAKVVAKAAPTKAVKKAPAAKKGNPIPVIHLDPKTNSSGLIVIPTSTAPVKKAAAPAKKAAAAPKAVAPAAPKAKASPKAKAAPKAKKVGAAPKSPAKKAVKAPVAKKVAAAKTVKKAAKK